MGSAIPYLSVRESSRRCDWMCGPRWRGGAGPASPWPWPTVLGSRSPAREAFLVLAGLNRSAVRVALPKALSKSSVLVPILTSNSAKVGTVRESQEKQNSSRLP